MRAGLTRQALKANPWTFSGPFVTQVLAAVLVTGSLALQRSIGAAPLDAAARRALNDSSVPDVVVLFLLVSIYLSILVVGVTMGAAIGRQASDIALVRAVGATPGLVRRAVAGQAMLVAVPAALAGYPLGLLGGRAWLDGLTTHGVIPAGVVFAGNPAALPIALAVTVGTSLPGAMIAAIRPSRVRPAVALTESASPRRRLGPVRTAIGILLVAAGAALSVVISHLDAKTANDEGLFVMLAMCVGAGFLAPALLRLAAPLARLAGPPGRLAADHLAARAPAYAGAFIPLTLSVAFAVVNVVTITTGDHVTGHAGSAADVWVEFSGTAVYAAFAAVAAVNALVTVLVSRRADLAAMRLAGGTRSRVLAAVTVEALIFAVTALAVATVVSAVTLLPMLHTALHTWKPYIPPAYLASILAVTVALPLIGTVLPAAAGMRRPAIETAR